MLFEEFISIVPYLASLVGKENQTYLDVAFLRRPFNVAVVTMVLTT